MKRPVAERGRLAGMPVPIKDLVEVAGVRSTQGSRIYARTASRRSPTSWSGHARSRGRHRLRDVEHTEFGAGANTFNEVFGATRNTVEYVALGGGLSSGGGRARDGMAWVAHGSGPGGGLRNPASITASSASGRASDASRIRRRARSTMILASRGRWRDVEDVACCEHGGRAEDPRIRSRVLRRVSHLAAARGSWRPDASRGRPTSDRQAVTARRSAASGRATFRRPRRTVEEAHPDLTGLHECFQTLRAYDFS